MTGTPLRVGAYYLPRGGQETLREYASGSAVGPIRKMECPSAGYEYSDGLTTRLPSGAYISGETSARDLVLECTADGVPLIGTETPAAYEGGCSWLRGLAKPAPFAFVAGQFYRLRNGGCTGPMMRSPDDTYWCDPEHKNAHGAPWEYRDDGTTEPAEFNVVGLADADQKSANPALKAEMIPEIRGAWIPKGEALTVASVTSAFQSMLLRRQRLSDSGELRYSDQSAPAAVAVLDPPIGDPFTCELRVGDIVEHKWNGAPSGYPGQYPITEISSNPFVVWFDTSSDRRGRGIMCNTKRAFFKYIRRPNPAG